MSPKFFLDSRSTCHHRIGNFPVNDRANADKNTLKERENRKKERVTRDRISTHGRRKAEKRLADVRYHPSLPNRAKIGRTLAAYQVANVYLPYDRATIHLIRVSGQINAR